MIFQPMLLFVEKTVPLYNVEVIPCGTAAKNKNKKSQLGHQVQSETKITGPQYEINKQTRLQPQLGDNLGVLVFPHQDMADKA